MHTFRTGSHAGREGEREREESREEQQQAHEQRTTNEWPEVEVCLNGTVTQAGRPLLR